MRKLCQHIRNKLEVRLFAQIFYMRIASTEIGVGTRSVLGSSGQIFRLGSVCLRFYNFAGSLLEFPRVVAIL